MESTQIDNSRSFSTESDIGESAKEILIIQGSRWGNLKRSIANSSVVQKVKSVWGKSKELFSEFRDFFRPNSLRVNNEIELKDLSTEYRAIDSDSSEYLLGGDKDLPEVRSFSFTDGDDGLTAPEDIIEYLKIDENKELGRGAFGTVNEADLYPFRKKFHEDVISIGDAVILNLDEEEQKLLAVWTKYKESKKLFEGEIEILNDFLRLLSSNNEESLKAGLKKFNCEAKYEKIKEILFDDLTEASLFKNKIIQSLSENLQNNSEFAFSLLDFCFGMRGKNKKMTEEEEFALETCKKALATGEFVEKEVFDLAWSKIGDSFIRESYRSIAVKIPITAEAEADMNSENKVRIVAAKGSKEFTSMIIDQLGKKSLMLMKKKTEGSLDKALTDQLKPVFIEPLQGRTVLADFKDGLKLIKGIASGLKEMHDAGIVHRDLAARNVLLGMSKEKTKNATVSDLGRSKEIDEEGKYFSTDTTGPVRWMAPEELQTKISSKASDVWSLGVTIYEIATGNKPYFWIGSLLEVGKGVIENRLSPEVGYPKSPAQFILNALVKRCCQFNPEDRITTQKLLEHLENLMSKNSFDDMVSYVQEHLM